MWWCRRVKKISLTDRVKKKEVLRRVKGKRRCYIHVNEGRLTALLTWCVETAFWITLLKEIQKEG
jgi:hypothetical protein